MKKRYLIQYRILLALCCAILIFSGCRSVEDDSVSLATIQVTPSDTSMNEGDVVQLTAARLYTNLATSDCTDVAVWSSSDTAVAAFSSTTNGMLSALAAGTTTISVSCSGKAKSYAMTVLGVATLESIEVTPLDRAIATPSKILLTATGVYSDGSTTDLTDVANWSSATVAAVTVERSSGSDSIQASAVAAGSSVITALYGGVTGSTTITVNAAVAVVAGGVTVIPANPSLAIGSRLFIKSTTLYDDDTVQETTDYVTWSTSNDTVAPVSNVSNGLTDGLATGGPVTIMANDSGTTGTTDVTVGSVTLDYIEVYPQSLSMNAGTSMQFTATGIYSDNTTRDLTNQVTWSASNSDLLSVNSSHRYNVRATALDKGTALLSASLPGSSKGASASITILERTLSTIEVTPASPSLPDNIDINFKATGLFSDGTKQDLTQSVVWSTSDDTVLKINNAFQIKGQARGVIGAGSGNATITATFGSTSGTSSVTVSATITLSSVDISPAFSYLANGYRRQLTATGIYSDGSSYDLTQYISWQSGAPTLVIENIAPWRGVTNATAVVGNVTIDANYLGANGQDGAVSGTATVGTAGVTLSSVEISPSDSTCLAGFNKQFTATGIFSDSSTLDMTKFVVWKTSDNQVATASNAPGVQGNFSCLALGNATITAASDSISGTTTLYVSTP